MSDRWEFAAILITIVIIVDIILAPLFAFAGSCVADYKRRSKPAWLVLCGLFFPMLMLLCLLGRKKTH